MKIIIAFFIFLLASSSFARNWKKHYNLVLSDIKSVEALNSRDLSLKVRLFELYGEKLSLLIEKERDYRIEFLETGSNKKLKILSKKQKRTLSQLDKLGNRIEKVSKDSSVLTKINYFRGLNYFSAKNEKKFFYYMKKAEKTNKDKKIGNNIHTKLANYYYNESKHKQAAKYYKKLLYDTKSPWITKHYYNLAWSELKMDNFTQALKYLKKSYSYSRRKGYFKIGNQLIDALLLFHAYANKTEEGLVYFKKNKLDSFDYLLKYLHYVFGHGKRSDVEYVVEEIKKKKLTVNQEYQFLSKKVLVYRTLKRFSKLQRSLGSFRNKILKAKKRKIDKVIKEELVLAVKSYSGYLQELIKSRLLITDKKKKNYISYIAYNFMVLKSIDPKNALEYAFYEGETFFSIDEHRKAIKVYSSGLKLLRKRKKKKDPYLKRTFDSLFKSLEKGERVKKSSLLYAFHSYIYFYPKGKKANEIHQRLLGIYKSNGDEKNMFKALRRYNKAFPSKLKVQKDFYKQVLNTYIDKKDLKALLKLQGLVLKGFLGFTVKESRSIDKIMKQIKFSAYSELAKGGKFQEAIDGFMKLYSDEKGKYSLRVDALRKAMFYQNKIYAFVQLTKGLLTAKKFMKQRDKKKHHDELLFYTQNICYGDYQKSCLAILKEMKKEKVFVLTDALNNFYFKLKTLFSTDLNKDYLAARNSSNKNFVFKLLLLEGKSLNSPLFKKYYRHSEMRGIIDGEAEIEILGTFYNTLSTSSIRRLVNGFSVETLSKKYKNDMSAVEKQLKKMNFRLPETPKEKIITEQIFVSFGQAVEEKVSKVFEKIQNIITQSDPNYLPYILSRVIARFESEVTIFKKFIPVSKDADFEAAMSDAIINFHKIFDGKIIEYRSLYFRTLQNTAKGSGVKKYGNDIITKPLTNSYGHITLWQK